jgi:hypothetical protein
MRLSLLREVVGLALDTLRTNKLRSALTVLGVVIGITSIVGMTSLIRGFDESLRDTIRQLGPNTVFVAQFSGVSVAGGADFADLLRRPPVTVDDAEAIERLAPSVGIVDAWLGEFVEVQERVSYDGRRTSGSPAPPRSTPRSTRSSWRWDVPSPKGRSPGGGG